MFVCPVVCCAVLLQAIDHTTQVLSLQYNRSQPVIFNTYQAYLKDSHTRMMEDMERARREGYVFAAKLVRHTHLSRFLVKKSWAGLSCLVDCVS